MCTIVFTVFGDSPGDTRRLLPLRIRALGSRSLGANKTSLFLTSMDQKQRERKLVKNLLSFSPVVVVVLHCTSLCGVGVSHVRTGEGSESRRDGDLERERKGTRVKRKKIKDGKETKETKEKEKMDPFFRSLKTSPKYSHLPHIGRL